MKNLSPFVSIATAGAALLILNSLAGRIAWRWDLTQEKRHTLDAITRHTLGHLPEVVTIKAYFSEELPAELLQARQQLAEQLAEYERASKGQLVYEFINPNETQESEQDAQQNGISPLSINIQKRDEIKQTRAYMGLVLYAQDRSEVIPYLQPNSPLEYQLTAAITKLTRLNKPPLALIQGHGEAEPAQLRQLQDKLSVLYEIEPFYIKDSLSIGPQYAAALWLNPTEEIASAELDKVYAYLQKGGHVLIAHNPLLFENTGTAPPRIDRKPPIGLGPWLERFHINVSEHAVADARCGQIQVQQQQGIFVFNQAVQFPYFPLIYDFAKHPITQGLEVLVFQFTPALSFTPPDSAYKATHLLFSSEKSAEVALPAYIDAGRQWTENDFTAQKQALAISLSGTPLPHANARLVVTTGPPFTNEANQQGAQPQIQHEDNINFIAGAIDWLADDTGLVNLRTKTITARPIKDIQDTKKNLLKYANLLLPIVLILGYGIYRRQRMRVQRRQWIS